MKQRWIVYGLVMYVLSAAVWSEPFEMEYDPEGMGLSAWVKLGTMVNGWCDYDGKVNAEQTFMDGGRTIFYGWTDADVARLGGGAVRAIAAKYYHDSNPPFEDMHLADNGGSLGMMANVVKPFTIMSDTLSEGVVTPCTITVSYDGLILLREQQPGEYSSGQIDFTVDLIDSIGEEDEEVFVVTNEGEEFKFTGQLRIEDYLAEDGVTHTYTAVGDMAPEICVNLDAEELGEDPDQNYWYQDNGRHVTVAVIDPEHPDQFEVLQGHLDAIPQAIQDSISNNPSYHNTNNRIYYVVFTKTTTFRAVVGKTYWFSMEMQSAAQSSLGAAGGWDGNETFVVCDFSNTAAYAMTLNGAQVVTLIDVDDDEVLGDGEAEIDGAVLRWSDDVALANAIELLNGHEATMDTNGYNGSVGAISGTGGLLKTGAGTLTLDEDCTFTGDTRVDEGGLVINGAFASDVLVEGGWLGGVGTLGGDLTVSGGSVRPGNSIGTLTVDHFELDGGTLEIELNDAGAADKIAATTAALTRGTVRAVPTEVITAQRDYTIIQTTGGITGSAANLNEAVSDRSFLLDYDLALSGDGKNLILTTQMARDFSEASEAGSNGNMRHITQILQNAADAGQGGAEMAQLQQLDEDDLNQAMGQMQPQGYQGASQVLGQQMGTVHGSTLGRIGTVQLAARQSKKGIWDYALADAGNGQLGEAMRASANLPQMSEGRWIGYSRTLNDWGKVDGDRVNKGYRWETHGVDVGAETFVHENFMLGTSIAALWSGVNGFEGSGNSDITSVYGNIYGSWFTDTWHFDSGLSYGHAWTETRRPIIPLGLRAKGDYESDIYSLFVGGGLYYDVYGYDVEPFVVYNYTLRSDGGCQESGAGAFNLDVQRNDTDSLRQTLGVRVSRMLTLDNGTHLRPFISAAWDYEYLNDQMTGSVNLLGSTYNNSGLKIDRNSGIFSGGLDWYLKSNISLFADYTMMVNRDLLSHTLNGGLRITF
jgi:outer membrane autotransporter protein